MASDLVPNLRICRKPGTSGTAKTGQSAFLFASRRRPSLTFSLGEAVFLDSPESIRIILMNLSHLSSRSLFYSDHVYSWKKIFHI